jgi:hypothetical protein
MFTCVIAFVVFDFLPGVMIGIISSPPNSF